jgi:hypothetical protein
MPPFLYRCPNTGDNVQASAADDPTDKSLAYIQVTCLACAQGHLVHLKTRKVLALMTNRSYFQFDTKSRLRRFFASSDGWSSLNKR